jgi:hypothetical protein
LWGPGISLEKREAGRDQPRPVQFSVACTPWIAACIEKTKAGPLPIHRAGERVSPGRQKITAGWIGSDGQRANGPVEA